ncbi:Organ specific protein [Sesbania bispinosa]|nr:Organ specific protein [Sesbania bispinosa]
MVMKDQEMPEGIQSLLQLKSHENSKQLAEGSKHKCEGTPIKNTQDIMEKKVFTEEFEPRPNVSAYEDDDTKGNKRYTKDFEPRPNVSAYEDDEKPAPVNTDFEPRPSATKYND